MIKMYTPIFREEPDFLNHHQKNILFLKFFLYNPSVRFSLGFSRIILLVTCFPGKSDAVLMALIIHHGSQPALCRVRKRSGGRRQPFP